MSRFNRSAGDVIKQTVLGITLGEYVIGLIGVLLALALKTNDVVAIVTSTSGFIGTLVVIAATLKINDWNLYAAGLGVVNFVDRVLGRRLNRATVTLALGVVGSVLSAMGILDSLTDFLVFLGVVFPPIAGIMVAEYFVVRTWRGELEESRAVGRLPESAPLWVPAALIVWLVAAAVGKYVDWGLPSINSLALAFLGYVVLGRLGLVRGVGTSSTGNDLGVEPPVARVPVAEPVGR
jgi:cytosine permease